MKNIFEKRFLLIVSLLVILFVVFYFLFFLFFSFVGVEAFLGLNFLFLLYFVYRVVKNEVYLYFFTITKNIWISYVSLIVLLIEFNRLVLGLLINYRKLFNSCLFAINSIREELINLNVNEFLNLNLLFIKNYVNMYFYNKLIMKKNFTFHKVVIYIFNCSKVILNSLIVNG
jgi:hypothetical protein